MSSAMLRTPGQTFSVLAFEPANIVILAYRLANWPVSVSRPAKQFAAHLSRSRQEKTFLPVERPGASFKRPFE